jgi:hypothetical protein
VSLCPLKAERQKRFNRASVDTFIVELEDIGAAIAKLRIGHDGTGRGAGWHLKKVDMKRINDDNDVSTKHLGTLSMFAHVLGI